MFCDVSYTIHLGAGVNKKEMESLLVNLQKDSNFLDLGDETRFLSDQVIQFISKKRGNDIRQWGMIFLAFDDIGESIGRIKTRREFTEVAFGG